MSKNDAFISRGMTKGFTLLEIVIVVAIIGIISIVSLVSLNGFRLKREVEGDARILASSIREAQNFAVTGKNFVGMCGTESCIPCSFRVRVSGQSYRVEQSSVLAAGGCSSFTGTSVSLLNGVSFVSDKEVRFDVPQAEPKIDDTTKLAPGSNVDFALTKGGVVIHVCVYPLGRVEERPVGVGC